MVDFRLFVFLFKVLNFRFRAERVYFGWTVSHGRFFHGGEKKTPHNDNNHGAKKKPTRRRIGTIQIIYHCTLFE